MEVNAFDQKKVRDMPSHIIWETGSGFSDDSTTGSDEDSEVSVRFRARARKVKFADTISAPPGLSRMGTPVKQSGNVADSGDANNLSVAYRAISPRYINVSPDKTFAMDSEHKQLTHHVCFTTGTDSEYNASEKEDSYSHYVLPALAEPQIAAEWDEDAIDMDPQLADGELPSLGSVSHGDAGGCKPCLFAFSKCGCANGVSCEFCHFRHKRKDKPRPCKGKRDRYKKLIAGMGLQGEI